jgi:rsbT co-antagonist protein RsbR
MFMSLEAENRVLNARLAAMEQREAELHDQKMLLEATLDNLTDGVAVANHEGVLIRFNPAAERILGRGLSEGPQGDWSTVYRIFRPDGYTPFPPDELPLARALLGEVVEAEEMLSRPTPQGEGIFLTASASPVLTADGRRLGAVTIFHDISERKRAERAMERQLAGEREKNELLESMQTAIQELSTPILELWDDVLALPVIGIVDSQRSVEMTEQLLEAVVRKQAQFVIIDVTGVELVDTATADRFLKLVTAVEYVGARCILTGIRGAVAQTLATLQVDLGSVITLRTLKDGLRECLRLKGNHERRPSARAQFERLRKP